METNLLPTETQTPQPEKITLTENHIVQKDLQLYTLEEPVEMAVRRYHPVRQSLLDCPEEIKLEADKMFAVIASGEAADLHQQGQLFAAKQALNWVLNPKGVSNPFATIMNNRVFPLPDLKAPEAPDPNNHPMTADC